MGYSESIDVGEAVALPQNFKINGLKIMLALGRCFSCVRLEQDCG